MAKHIVIIQGHPDLKTPHFGHALEQAYSKGAQEAGHQIRHINVAELNIPMLRSQEEWEDDNPPGAVKAAQQTILWADHLIIIYPLWLGTMPAMLKAFFEQVYRPNFAIEDREPNKMPKKLLKGKSAHIVVTMGMPAFFYRWYFRAHSLKNLERNILGFSGIGPIRSSIIGMVESPDNKKHLRWLQKMKAFGRLGQ